jgi:hypothetical protein
MSVVIRLERDTLDEEVARFAQTPLREPVFLNSVPKSGTHLLRNILRMFVPAEQAYHRDFIQLPTLHQHQAAFSRTQPWLSWGHLLFADASAIALRDVRHLVLVRDPYDWVLARARFFLSEEFKGPLEHIKGGAASIEDVMNLMIFGALDRAPGLNDIYSFNAAAWLGTAARLVRYEELVEALRTIDAPASQRYFADLLAACGIDALPEDWRERVRIGADRKYSGTAREKLSVDVAIPATLPFAQRRLVEYAAPGLRSLLGYA